MKTMIAVPCMDQVPVHFCQSLALLQKVDECTLAMQSGSLVHAARNKLVEKALIMDADYVMWLDSDMTFPPDTLSRMLKTAVENDIDILTGLCFRRVPPYTPTLFDRLELKKHDICSWTEFEEIPDHLFEVGGCGCACLLVNTEVFISIQNEYGNIFAPIGSAGEDVSFCLRARNRGYKIWCDPTVVCGHVGYTVIDDKFYKAYKAAR